MNFVNQTDRIMTASVNMYIQTLKGQPDLVKPSQDINLPLHGLQTVRFLHIGDYLVTLDAFTKTVAPSGHVYECHDTVTP